MVLFSHRTVQLPGFRIENNNKLSNGTQTTEEASFKPSLVLSQKHELAVCNPAPFFCMMIDETFVSICIHRCKEGEYFKDLTIHRTNVLEGLVQCTQALQTSFHDVGSPLIHLALLVCVHTDRLLHTL